MATTTKKAKHLISGGSPGGKPQTAPKVVALNELKDQATKSGSAALKRALALLLLISRRKARIAEDFYEIGEALRALQKREHYLALGHASFAEMLKARDVMGLSQAKKLIQIVSSMPRDKALSVGPEKAYALTRYTAATPELDTPSTLLDSDASIRGKSVKEISASELRAEAGKVRAKAADPKPKDPAEKAANEAARSMQAALRKRGAKTATVTCRRAKGAYWLRIDLPVASAASFVKE